MNTLLKYLILIFLLSSFNVASAFVRPTLEIPRVIAESDDVVVGTVTSVALNEILVRVDNIFQSTDITNDMIIQIDAPSTETSPSMVFNWIRVGERRMFFLKKQKTNFVPTDLYYPSILFGKGPANVHQDPMSWIADALIEKVVADAPFKGNIRSTFGGMVPYGLANAQGDNKLILGYLNGIAHIVTLPLLVKRLDSTTNDASRLWLSTALMMNGEMKGLQSVMPFFINNSAEMPVDTNVAFLEQIYSFKLNDPEENDDLARTLAPLLDMNKVAATQAVYGALRHNPSDIGIPLLIRGIGAADFMTSYLAVSGLAVATGAGPEWTMAGYRQQKDEIDSFWKNWSQATEASAF